MHLRDTSLLVFTIARLGKSPHLSKICQFGRHYRPFLRFRRRGPTPFPMFHGQTSMLQAIAAPAAYEVKSDPSPSALSMRDSKRDREPRSTLHSHTGLVYVMTQPELSLYGVLTLSHMQLQGWYLTSTHIRNENMTQDNVMLPTTRCRR